MMFVTSVYFLVGPWMSRALKSDAQTRKVPMKKLGLQVETTKPDEVTF
jgi:hypothetical protein